MQAMKTSVRSSLIFCALFAALGLFPSAQARGQTFTTLCSFSALTVDTHINGETYYYDTNSDGAYPLGGLILSGNTLYGAASH
jgi:hypothetical protein